MMDHADYTEAKFQEIATELFGVAMMDAQRFTREKERSGAGMGGFGKWIAHMVEIGLPMAKVSGTLPAAELIAFRDFLDKFYERLELAICEAEAREFIIH
jgi:hypothetical protein